MKIEKKKTKKSSTLSSLATALLHLRPPFAFEKKLEHFFNKIYKKEYLKSIKKPIVIEQLGC